MKKTLTEKERKILDVFARVIPSMNELEKERMLGYVEGMSAIKSMQTRKDEERAGK
ncbi:MAG: hypothetical protein Q4D42_02930 [Eubacteriales bacterium]|nr:hypothetical protein [Eubacteriales bacterium]